jgi:hypothetical protein
MRDLFQFNIFQFSVATVCRLFLATPTLLPAFQIVQPRQASPLGKTQKKAELDKPTPGLYQNKSKKCIESLSGPALDRSLPHEATSFRDGFGPVRGTARSGGRRAQRDGTVNECQRAARGPPINARGLHWSALVCIGLQWNPNSRQWMPENGHWKATGRIFISSLECIFCFAMSLWIGCALWCAPSSIQAS